MTNREITDRYLKYKGMTRTKPESLGFQPILPFYVMDVVYEIYCKYVMPLPAARELKKAKNEWREALIPYRSNPPASRPRKSDN